MEIFLEILKYILPSLVVFATAYVMVNKLADSVSRKHNHEMHINAQKLTLPVKLQAYERLMLFLERISPESLLLREMSREMNVAQFQSRLLQSIRAEYEHNLSQQIYVSSEAWKILKGAKENVVKLINSIAADIENEKPAFELSKTILELIVKSQTSPTIAAIEYIKNEVRQNFK